MNKPRKYFLKLLPYLVCIVAACGLLMAGNKFGPDIRSLMHGIAGSFLAIPLLYLIYDLSKNYSQRSLNKELFDYAKMQIDRTVLSAINQSMKLVWPYEEVTISPETIDSFLSQTKDDFVETIKANDYLGFQVFKNWSITENNIASILENSFILQRLDNDQLIAIIDLLKNIRLFEFIPRHIDDLYIPTGKTAEGYRIKSGSAVGNRNDEYPDRYLLLKHLEKDSYRVRDFGDFALYQKDKLLQTYKMNDKHMGYFADSLLDLITSINLWIKLTGNEFLIDLRMFRPSLRKTDGKQQNV